MNGEDESINQDKRTQKIKYEIFICLQTTSIGAEINTQEGKLKHGHHREGVEEKKILLEDYNHSKIEDTCQRQVSVQIRRKHK